MHIRGTKRARKHPTSLHDEPINIDFLMAILINFISEDIISCLSR